MGSSYGHAGVQVATGVNVEVEEGVGEPVLVGVSVGVQIVITLGTGSRRSWQPLAKSMVTPKSLLSKPVNGPPPPQSPSKSTDQV